MPSVVGGSKMKRSKRSEGDRADGCCAHLGDEAPIHHRKGFAGGSTQQFNESQMSRNPQRGVSGIEGDRFDSHHIARNDGHDGEPAVVHAHSVAGAQDGARRLIDESCGVIDQSLTNGRNEGRVGEALSDLVFGDKRRIVHVG